ncbi:Trehalose-6-phosphate hydrolase [Tatumella ptyseos]|uniref:Trehalose-6-phosphate hydrolase n=1 Tax=Tatumella ptyseos TaxID=82987 RepID=A0A2X5NMP5_9GAMM|nr:Trehalose-6-phosphate hydrolase [Tatumella ptyseos]
MEKTWTQDKVVYQIYPKSFQDTTGKGTGDLQGIISHLDYLHFLGVDILWLTPVYPSPQVDNGYDVADYCAIDPRYGTLDDFDQLVAEAHQRNLKIMMDMVFNHTSTQHPWFIQACDPHSPYHPYYIWRDSPPDIPPTNWQSKFGGPAWQWQPECGQHYLHLFSKEQADLNWEHPPVREALKDVCRFWAARGVDALRLDVVNLISKPEQFRDDPDGDGRRFYTDGPRVHEFLQEMNRDVFRPLNLITVGEMSSTSLQHCQQYASCDNTELSMVFNFHHLKIDYADGDKWTRMAPDVIALKKIFALWQSGMHQRANGALFWCNHDQPAWCQGWDVRGNIVKFLRKCWRWCFMVCREPLTFIRGKRLA